MASKYIDAKTFAQFSENQEKLIEILNCNMTKLTDAVIDIKVSFAELLGGQKVLKKIVYWILGIMAVLLTGGVLSSYM